MNLVTDDKIDQLFAPKQLRLEPTTTTRCTCRVCERAGDRVADGILLCPNCARNVDQTREHIKHTLKAHYGRIEETWGALEQAIPNDPDDALSSRWGAFQMAVARQAPEARQAETKARNGMPGPLADLIRLWCAWRDAMGIYEERKRWADTAELVLSLYADEVL